MRAFCVWVAAQSPKLGVGPGKHIPGPVAFAAPPDQISHGFPKAPPARPFNSFQCASPFSSFASFMPTELSNHRSGIATLSQLSLGVVLCADGGKREGHVAKLAVALLPMSLPSA